MVIRWIFNFIWTDVVQFQQCQAEVIFVNIFVEYMEYILKLLSE